MNRAHTETDLHSKAQQARAMQTRANKHLYQKKLKGRAQTRHSACLINGHGRDAVIANTLQQAHVTYMCVQCWYSCAIRHSASGRAA
eukprot:365761-Chlamydomonas_euryale.AAC.3